LYRSIYNRLRNILCEKANIKKKEVKISTLVTSLGLDELELIELAADIEHEFDVELPDNIFEEFNSFGEIIGFIEAEMGR